MNSIEEKWQRINNKILYLKENLRTAEILKTECRKISSMLADLKNQLDEKTYFYTMAMNIDSISALKWILRDLNRIETDLHRAMVAYEYIEKYWHQSQNSRYKEIDLVHRYVEELSTHLGLENSTTLTLWSDDYYSFPFSEINFHILFFPVVDLSRPRWWGLLSHELGHIYYDLNKENLKKSLLQRISRIIRRRIPEVVRKDQIPNFLNLALKRWIENWTEEFVADCVATKLIGPTYPLLTSIELLNYGAKEWGDTHPSSDKRLEFCVEVSKKLMFKNSKDILDATIDTWKQHMLPLPDSKQEYAPLIDDLIITKILSSIQRSLKDAPIRSLWDKILLSKKRLAEGKTLDLKSELAPQICALSILGQELQLDR